MTATTTELYEIIESWRNGEMTRQQALGALVVDGERTVQQANGLLDLVESYDHPV